jgi:hypothetical protein
MNQRLLTTIALCVAILAFPYWVYIPALVLSTFIFKFYWEGIVLAFLIDILYGHSSHMGISLAFPFAIYASIFVLILLPLHERIRFNA